MLKFNNACVLLKYLLLNKLSFIHVKSKYFFAKKFD